jgi:hypothetical protein
VLETVASKFIAGVVAGCVPVRCVMNWREGW